MSAEDPLPLALGQVLIAIAWSDGVLEPGERERLGELLFRLPGLTPALWERLHSGIDQPVSDDARDAAITALQYQLESPELREQVSGFLDELAADESPFGEADRALANALIGELRAPAEGFLGKIGESLRSTLHGGSIALRSMFGAAAERDADHDDHPADLSADLGAEKLHRLRTMGALLARVVHAKGEADQRELDHIRNLLSKQGALEPAEAEWVLDLVVQDSEAALDTYALSRAFFELTDEDQRIGFLDLLFDVAYADGVVEDEEIQEIRRIRHALLLSQRHFADARVRARKRRES